MAFDWKNTGDYGSVADLIATVIPQLHPLSLGAASSALSCSRQRDLPTAIARAVSSLHKGRSIIDMVPYATVKDGE